MINRHFQKWLMISFCLLSPIIALQFYLEGNWYSLFSGYTMGIVFGVFAYGYFLNTLILSSRIRYIDRLFGHDRVMLFHGILALTATILGITHFVFKYEYIFPISSHIALGITALSVFIVILILTILLMTAGAMHQIAMIIRLRDMVQQRIKVDYSRMKLLHNIVILGVTGLAFHVALASSTAESPVRTRVMTGWAILAIVVYIWHKAGRLIVNSRQRWKLAGVRERVPGIVELQIHNDKSKRLQFHPGQFAYLRLKSEICGFEEHPFTIASAPSTPDIVMTIKALGDYTKSLVNVSPETMVYLDGPYGLFSPRQNGKPFLFIAGGIGITPFMSIVESWKSQGFKSPVTLIWSVRREEELFCRELFESGVHQSTMFRFIPVISRPLGDNAPTRRIDRTLIQSALGQNDKNNMQLYFCGPDTMRNSVIAIMKQLELPLSNLHYERFS